MARNDVKGASVTVIIGAADEYLPFTDIVRTKDSYHADGLSRNRNTMEAHGIWKQSSNPGFNPVEFDGIKMQAGLHSYIHAGAGRLEGKQP